MDSLSIYADALDADAPIEVDGFTIYPILMSEYRTFTAVKNALLVRQSSLPAKYAFVRYLSALYAMDYDADKEKRAVPGFIGGVLRLLALAMRYPADALLRQTIIKTPENNERELISLEIRTGDRFLHLTPAVFDRLRPLLAAQNGLELPDESENPDLVEAENDIAASAGGNLVQDIRTVLASVARDQRLRRSDLLKYTIREFTELRDAIERDKLFMLYKAAELNGAKFTGGNPVPSWCFDARGKANSLIPMAKFMEGPGSAAAMK